MPSPGIEATNVLEMLSNRYALYLVCHETQRGDQWRGAVLRAARRADERVAESAPHILIDHISL
jgi:hypothetical protein